MKIYLASPFFNEAELEVYRRVITILRAEGYEVYVPQEHTIEGGWDMSNADWANRVYVDDIKAIEQCECVMILNFGMYSDSGTAWEAGYALAKDKWTVQVLCGNENTTYSLMMLNGCDKIVHLKSVAFFEHSGSHADLLKVIQK